MNCDVKKKSGNYKLQNPFLIEPRRLQIPLGSDVRCGKIGETTTNTGLNHHDIFDWFKHI